MTQPTLPSLSEVIALVRTRLTPREREILQCDLAPARSTEADIEAAEAIIGERLSPQFRRFILTYELNGFAAGPIAFGDFRCDTMAEALRELNTASTEPFFLPNWWAPASKKPGWLLMIGGTDGYVLLVDSSSEHVFAYQRTDSWESRVRIAANIERLIRGAMMITLNPEWLDDAGVHRLAQLAGAEPAGHDYWLWP